MWSLYQGLCVSEAQSIQQPMPSAKLSSEGALKEQITVSLDREIFFP